MNGIESMVPGFAKALTRTPLAGDAWAHLTSAISLGPRELALVSVAVAAQSGDDYARWVMERLASRRGLTGEDILLASAGCALDARENDLVRGAMALARGGAGPDRLVEAVALARLECAIVAALAPPRAMPARKGA